MQAGGSLTIGDSTLSSGAVNPGAAGGPGAGAGDAFGSGIFIQGTNNVTFTPASGQTDVISDVIADQNGSLPSNSASVGGVVLDGPGTLELDAVNSFTGGVTIHSGTLDLAIAGAGGYGPVTFAAGSLGDVVEFNNALGLLGDVIGSSGTIDLNLANVDVSGGGDTIISGRRSSAILSNTNGDSDTFHGSHDTISLFGAQASVIGRSDTITATAGSLARLANTGTDDDVFTGDDDVVRLNNAEVTLNGSSDTVRFAGSDSVVANGQSDAFVFGADLGVSSITGFEANERLRLSAADWTSFAALQVSNDLFQSGNNAVIEISATDMLTLVNTQVSELSATNVKFQ